MEGSTNIEISPVPTLLKQIGALPIWRDPKGQWRVVLVTTRDSGRWSIPKGNPIKGKKPYEAAAMEAHEEGGLIGTIAKTPIGSYDFWKRRSGHWVLANVSVYVLKVETLSDTFKEMHLRRVEPFSFDEAMEQIVEPGLASLIRSAATRFQNEAP